MIIRATAVLVLALVATRLARRSCASVRHVILAACFAVLLVLPISSIVDPMIRIPLPIAIQNTIVPSVIEEASFDVSQARSGRNDVTQRPTTPDPSVSFSDLL